MNKTVSLADELESLPRSLRIFAAYISQRFKIPATSCVALVPGVLASMAGSRAQIMTRLGPVSLNMQFASTGDTRHRETKRAGELLTSSLAAKAKALQEYARGLSLNQINMLHEAAQRVHAEDSVRHDRTEEALVKSSRTSIEAPYRDPPEMNLRGQSSLDSEEEDEAAELSLARRVLTDSGLKLAEATLMRRPLVQCDRLLKGHLDIWGSRAYDGHVQVIGAGPEALASLTRGQEQELMSDFIRAGIGETAGSLPIGNNLAGPVCLSMLLSFQPDEFIKFVREPKVGASGLLGQLVFLERTDAKIKDREFSEEEITEMERVVESILKLRYYEKKKDMLMDADAEEYYRTMGDEPGPEVGQVPEGCYEQTTLNALRLAGCWALVAGEDRITLGYLQLAEKLLLFIRRSTTGILRKAMNVPVTEEADAMEVNIKRMVDKLRMKQPCTKRDLYRTFDDQRGQVNDPVLNEALNRGMIVNEAGKLMVCSQDCQCVSASVRQWIF